MPLPEQEVSAHLRSFCLFGKFQPSRSGNYYWNFQKRNVDEAILDFWFGKNQMKAHFLLSIWEIFMLSLLKHNPAGTPDGPA